MNTQEQILEVAKTLKQHHLLRSRMEEIRRSLVGTASSLKVEVDRIEEALKVEYTPYCILLKRKPAGGFECLAIINHDDVPEDCPEDFDLCLPIPNPASLPDFQGW